MREILKNILCDVPHKNFAEKKLFQDLLMDEVDFMNLALDIEHFCGVSISDEMINQWLSHKLSLTVEQVINDCNALVEKP